MIDDDVTKKHKIGRIDPHFPAKSHFAFYLRRADDGGIHISGIDRGKDGAGGLLEDERKQLFHHFGSPITALAGGPMGPRGEALGTWTETAQPGTEKHFLHAICQLPWPFRVQGR